MDALTFAAEVIKAIAWPVTILVIFLVLRSKIADLLPLLREFKYKELSLTFGDRVRELAVEAEGALGASRAPEALPGAAALELDKLARLSPRSAVLEAWIPVEQAASRLALARGIELSAPSARTATSIIRALERAGAVSAEESHLYQSLRRLRNEAAHAAEFAASRDAVTEYIEVSQRLAATFDERRGAA